MSPLKADWPACWCGGAARTALTDDYRICSACGTLVSSCAGNRAHYQWVGDDESGHYGADYWREHVPGDLKQPTLDERARSDLKERCLDWLARMVETDPPPASVLELGCAHGGFVYLLEAAGYQAEGLEMSPAVVAGARERFAITVHRGPIEGAGIGRRFDIIVAMDLLEHLVDPRGTLEACRDHLEPGGTLLLQTPCYRGEGEGWPMLLAADHLFLYTARSSTQLLSAAGWVDIEMTEALFPHDMWIRARRPGTRAPAVAQSAAGAQARHGSAPTAIVRALLDLRGDCLAQTREREAIDADRRAKEETIARVLADHRAIDADRRAKEEIVRRVVAERDESDADRQAKEVLLRKVVADRDAIDADRQAKDALIARVTADRDAIDADRQAKDALIARVTADRDAIDADRQAKDDLIASVIAERDAIDADRWAKDVLIRRLIEQHDGAGEMPKNDSGSDR